MQADGAIVDLNEGVVFETFSMPRVLAGSLPADEVLLVTTGGVF